MSRPKLFKEVPFNLRLSNELMSRINKYTQFIEEKYPGVGIANASTVIRMLIVRGLDVVEQELGIKNE